jgi:hypothetical protein
MLFERDLSQANKLGRREEIANLISLIDAKDTPFTSMARKGAQPQQTFFRWQVDSLPEPKTSGTVDGTDVSNADHENFVKEGSKQYRNEIGNFIQIFRRSTRVSKLTQSSVTNIAGVKDELQNNVSKAMTLLKRDMEKTMCSANNAAAEKSVTVNNVTSIQPYKTRGLDKWLVKAADKDTAETNAIVPDEFCLPYDANDATSSSLVTGALADLTETTLQNVLTSIYKQTGQYKTYDCLAGPLMKRAFTNLVFTTKQVPGSDVSPTESVRNFNRNAADSTYTSSIDVFDGDFGQLRIHPSLFLKNFSVGYIIPFDLVEIRYGGNVAEITSLPDYGGGPARLIEAVAALCVHNPLAFGKLDLT